MMGFLAPWMLLGALTAAIPIALHLIQRHKPVVVHWAAMDFLLQSIRETRSASRLRDMILLACRVLLLALAAFALSRPLFGWFSGSGPVDLALLLDISGSMATSESTPEGPRTRLELLKTEAALLLQSLPAGSRVRMLPFGDGADTGQGSPEGTDPAAAQELLSGLQQTSLGTRLEPALDLAGALLRQSDMSNKKVWIVSDAPASVWTTASGALRTLSANLPGATFGWSRLGKAPASHIQMLDSSPEGGLLLANVRQPWRVRIRNNGTETARAITVRLAIDRAGGSSPSTPSSNPDPIDSPSSHNTPDEISVAELAPGQERVLHLEALLPAGRLGLIATAFWANERWPGDGQLASVVEARAPKRVLIVEKPFSPDMAEGSGFFLEQALQALAGDTPGSGISPNTTQNNLEIIRCRPTDLDTALLANLDMVFLAGISPVSLPEEKAAQLLNWCQAGKLLVAWGPFQAQNNTPSTPPGSPWGSLFTDTAPARTLATPSVPNVSRASGFLAPFAQPPLDQLGRLALRRLHPAPEESQTEGPPTEASAKKNSANSDCLLKASSGEPLVRRHSLGRGEVIRLDLGVDPADSDLVLSAIFPPLVGALASQADTVALAGHNLPAGTLPASLGLDTGLLSTGPSGLLRSNLNTAQTNQAKAWRQAGIWHLEENSIPVPNAIWAIRGGVNEGDDLEPAAPSLAKDSSGGVLMVTEGPGANVVNLAGGNGSEAGWWLLAAVLALLFGEGLVARWAGSSL